MKKSILIVSLFMGATLLVWGCMGKNGSPVSPSRVISLSVNVSNINGVRAKLLGATQNVILYRIDGTSGAPVTGSVGPFSTSGNSGSYLFTIPNFVSSGNSLLSLQLNDASSRQALAIGAAQIVSTSGIPIVNVELGSIVRPCYDISGASVTLSSGYAFGFSSDEVDSNVEDTGTGLDIAFFNDLGNGFDIWDATTVDESFRDIAYLGNGNLVDFDQVPPDSDFYFDSNDAKNGGQTQVVADISGLNKKSIHSSALKAKFISNTIYNMAVGDVYCIKLTTIPGAHAWIQITDTGIAGITGPSFV
jgi:hypothetical protein